MNSSLSRDDVRRLRRLEQALKALRESTTTYFSITKLTSIKSLCKDDNLRREYCLYLSSLAVDNAKKDALKEGSKQLDNLVQEAERTIIDITKHHEHEEMAREALYRIMDFQDETKKVKWTVVRVIKNTNLLVLENILQALLARSDVALEYVYDATKHYVEKYNPYYGTGLLVASVPMLEQIISFWKRYECRE